MEDENEQNKKPAAIGRSVRPGAGAANGIGRINIMEQIGEYCIKRDDDRNGWCIFIKDSALTLIFVAGAFESKEYAAAECFKLNGRTL